jgi:probable rRNA maturation factor
MIVHGSLHLIGYDHEDDLAAKNMEALEIKILGDLDFPSPYINIGDMNNS